MANGNNKFLTYAIILISLTAVIYFAYRSVGDNSERKKENPYEYNIENYKKTADSLVTYKEEKSLEIDAETFYGLAVDSEDNMLVSVENKILIYNSSKILNSSFQINEPAYCLTTSENKIFIGTAEHIEIYDYSGNQLAKWESLGKEAIITSIAVTDKNLYAADAGNLVVLKYDLEGNIISEIGKKDETKDVPGYVIPSPYFDLDIDPDGYLWVANTGRHSFENYTNDGAIRTSWGVASMNIEGFGGCCNPSHFTIMPDGSFITTEKGIPRIKIYNSYGILKSVVAKPSDFIEGTVDLDVAIDSKGKIYVMDQEKKSIRIFSKIKN